MWNLHIWSLKSLKSYFDRKCVPSTYISIDIITDNKHHHRYIIWWEMKCFWSLAVYNDFRFLHFQQQLEIDGLMKKVRKSESNNNQVLYSFLFFAGNKIGYDHENF